MTGLIYKDFLALKGHLTTYLVFFLVYGGLCLSGVFTASVLCGSSLAMFIPPVYFALTCTRILPMTLFLYRSTFRSVSPRVLMDSCPWILRRSI